MEGLFDSYRILLNVAGCVACGYLAKKKGKKPLLYAILGFILPLVGIIVVLVMKPAQTQDNSIETDFEIKPDEEPAQEDPFHSEAEGAPYASQSMPEAPHAPAAPKFCQYCGTPLETSDKFCTNCGAPVEK